MSEKKKEKKQMQPFDYSKVKDHPTYHILMPLAMLMSKTLFRVTYVGKENIPKEGGFIIASNHVHFMDPIMIAASHTRVMHFMAKEELFVKKINSFFLTGFNAFPIRRGSSDKTSLEFAIKVVEEGQVLGIFPEGTRSKTFVPQAGKAGVALIAKAAHSDVLPVSVYTDKQAKYFTKLTIRFGEVIPYEDLGLSEDATARELRSATRLIMDRITKLWEGKHAN